ncbi:MAG: integral rane sensor signal transduction histidine kinase [Bacteroidetes bacterium]|nr:integral rane sensor signal transduction histidine kinase [Bacteroidota bacterium]
MTLNRRLFLYFFSTFFLLIAIITFFQYQREKEFRTEQLDQLLTTYNYTIDKFVDNKNRSYQELSELIHVFPDTALRVTLVDLKGNVLYDNSVKKGVVLENHLHRPEIQMANNQKTGKAIRHSATMGIDYYYLAHKFNHYYIRTALPYNLNLSSMLKANMFFLYFMAFVLVMAVFALFFISKNFSDSINRLRIFTQQAEKGEIPDTDIKFPNDELGEISSNIVHLYKRMERTKDEVNKEREKLIKHLLISQEGLGIFSSNKKEILANSHFIQYTNILSDQQSESSDEIFDLPEFDEINQFIHESLQNDQLTRKRIVIEKNGRAFMVRCIVFQDNTFEISINDITVQEHENELKRHLTQNISHELKTPVSSILGYMESILDNPDLDQGRQRLFIERSYQQAQRLSALLHDISTLNKIDEAKRLYEKEDCDIAHVIEEVLYDVHMQIEQRDCKILKNFQPRLPARGNRSLLYSIFRNLIDNALAYAGDNLTIDINCYREDEQYYYFTFSDNGIGISEEHLSKIFERFYRVDKGRSRKLGGTGLGLAIVKNAVLFHKGTISAKSSPSGGLSFVFSLRKT